MQIRSKYNFHSLDIAFLQYKIGAENAIVTLQEAFEDAQILLSNTEALRGQKQVIPSVPSE